MKRMGIVALLAMAIIVFTAQGWDTNKSAGTSHAFHAVTATGAIVGSGAGIPRGVTFLSLVEVVPGATASTFYIRSSDLKTSPDTLTLGNGVPYAGNFPHGVDSLACMTLGGGATFSAEGTN